MSLGYRGWVKLNVGGEYFNTSRLTLVSCPDSLLAKMFDPDSGREPAYNEDGVYFLDVNPKYFRVILDWLRHRKVMADADTNLNNVAKVADFFGLEELLEELKMIGSVVFVSDEGGASEMEGEHMGLYLKGADNTYHQAGGETHLYQDGQGAWFINDTLDQHAGYLQNHSRLDTSILPRYKWKYGNDEIDTWWEDDELKVVDATNVKFCNIISVSSTKYTRKEYLGEFSRVPGEWLNGWPVFINNCGKKLGVPTGKSEWHVGEVLNKGSCRVLDDTTVYAVSSGRVTSCPAHPRSGIKDDWETTHWHFWDEENAKWIEDKTMEIKCDVHA